ncbi:MAG: PorT family protein [Muribaculaceae bacterium]|nr:PorT family protein [Muribaculaceae bacterium]
MKKFLVLIAVLVMTAVSSTAQNFIFNNPNNKAYWGIRVSPEIACPGKVSESVGSLNVKLDAFNSGGGVEFGGIYNIPVVANFYIEPGVKFFYDTYSVKKEFLSNPGLVLNSLSIKKFGMRIPVMAGYHFDFTNSIKVYLFTGPELEIGLSAKEYAKGQHNIEMSESIYGDEGDLNRVDLLWGLGAGVSYNHFYFSISGGLGMLNMLSDSYAKFHENRVTFSFGYNF